jgi:pyruvate,water dikinase
MAVLIQLQLRPEVSGVLFTGETATIEANWGLGTSVVSGLVTPDSWTIENGVTSASLGSKHRRTDLHDDRMVTTSATDQERGTLCLTEAQVAQVLVLGREAEVVLGGPLDVEWCSVDGSMHLLQARPITAAPEVRRASARRSSHPNTRQGIPGSPGRATGRARVVRSPAGLADFRRGDVLVAEHTDPAWTPAFALASAVVTEHGGRLSHAAIVAREAGIPAVLSVPGATAACAAGRTLTVDGDGGRVTVHLRR